MEDEEGEEKEYLFSTNTLIGNGQVTVLIVHIGCWRRRRRATRPLHARFRVWTRPSVSATLLPLGVF